jgi:hypothetical protein
VGNFLIGLSIPIGILILLILVIFLIIKFSQRKSTSKLQKDQGSSTQSEPASGNTNPPSADHGHDTPKKKSKFWSSLGAIAGVIALIVFVLWAVSFGIKTVKYLSDFFTLEENKVHPKSLPEKSLPDSIITLKDTIIEYYHLSKGSQKVIYTRPGYNYIRHSGGWKYYCKTQNEPYFTIHGGNPPIADDVGIKYFYVKFYEVECDIKIIFVKI